MSQGTELSNVCEGLLFRIFRPPSEVGGVVIALTAAHRGAGVSEIARALVGSLRQMGEEMAVSLSCGSFKNENSWFTGDSGPAVALGEIRRAYRYVFVDCGSLAESQDIIRLAPLVDGVLLVIEANRTCKSQILYAERTIEAVNGRILGLVLNKRRYVVPKWIHSRLAASGV